MEWVLSGLLGVLMYTLRAVRKRDAARASAARLRNVPTEAEAGASPAGKRETAAPERDAPGGESRTRAGKTASILQPGPRVFRIREESDR